MNVEGQTNEHDIKVYVVEGAAISDTESKSFENQTLTCYRFLKGGFIYCPSKTFYSLLFRRIRFKETFKLPSKFSSDITHFSTIYL